MSVQGPTSENATSGIIESEARRHLESVLASPVFSKTKRHARFLRFVVDKTFAGHADEIKERTLGIEIFDRNPSYDLSDDPIVRVTAGDIRKRLQQYYREDGEREGIRLELPTGSYVPVFRPHHSEKEPLAPLTTFPTPVREQPAAKRRRIWAWALPATAVALTVSSAAVFGWGDWSSSTRSERDLRRFWAPLESNPDKVIELVVGDLNALHHGPSVLVNSTTPPLGSRAITGPGNTYALAEIADRMGADHVRVQAFMADNVNLSELRAQPSVLIGAFDNPWTERLLEGQRFTMEQDREKDLVGIRDSAHPDATQWIRLGTLDNSNGKDFALVTRKRSPLTGEMAISVCGVGSYGTVAAAEFLTRPEYFEEFARNAPSNWADKELQIVIAVNVVDGRTSPPTVLSYAME